MILFIHNNKDLLNVVFPNGKRVESSLNKINKEFFRVAEQNKSEMIVWCNEKLIPFVNNSYIASISEYPNSMHSFETSNSNFIDSSIGYVDQTPFVNISKDVRYPSWLMSSDIGVISSKLLLKFKELLKYKLSFEELLNYISKQVMSKGVLCYSNPNLLNDNFPEIKKEKISKTKMFRFIKSNYRMRWTLLYLINLLIYRKSFTVFPLIDALIYRNVNFEVGLIKEKTVKFSSKNLLKKPSVDVLIPTLGRKEYLKDVLLDLSKQTVLPSKVIIIEQQFEKGESSTLDYLNESWPFEIDHTLIYQLGACNARNIGLTKVSSNWVFLADDDIRFSKNLIEKSFKFIEQNRVSAVTLSCLQSDQIEIEKEARQWPNFGSGCSIVKSSSLQDLHFDEALEFGYGEDFDFGMQLRKNGIDVLYIPFIKMLHLKAPIGGFRKNFVHVWEKDLILPKPSPTVLVSKLKNSSIEQLQNYKTILYLKFFKSQSERNPFKYIKRMNMRWDKSFYWADKLMENTKNEI